MVRLICCSAWLALVGFSLAAQNAPTVEIVDAREFDPSELREGARTEIESIESGEGNAADAADAAFQIQRWIHDQGYPEAVVRSRLLNETPTGVVEIDRADAWELVDRVQFVVREGPRRFFGTVELVGVAAFSRSRLREFFPAADQEPFQETQLTGGLAQLRELYRERGYARAEIDVSERSIRRASARQFVDLTINIREGLRYRIDEVVVHERGAPREETARLAAAADVDGEWYIPRRATEGALAIRNELSSDGYRPDVSTETRFSADGHVTIAYRVSRGRPIRAQEVRVVNLGEDPLRTDEEFILAYVPVQPGERIDFPALDRTERRLYGLGVFSRVEIEVPEDQPRADGLEPIEVRVREVRSRYMELAAGWGSYELVRGSVSYVDRNVFGRARSARVTAEGSFRSYGIESSITDRVILSPVGSISVSGGLSFRDAVSYDRRSLNAEASLSYRVDDSVSLGTSYRFELSQVTNVESDAADTEDDELRTGRVQFSAVYDTRDSVLAPRRGWYARAAPFLSAPVLGSEVLFAGGRFELVRHLSIGRRVTLSASGDYRVRRRLRDGRSLPIQERIFLGGAGSVRSFTQDALGLVGEGGSPRGGLSAVVGTVELRVRAVDEFHGALFYDIGYLAERAGTFEGDIGHAVGAGVRYYLPVGPIRLDFAYNPGETYAADRPYAVHFAVGLSY